MKIEENRFIWNKKTRVCQPKKSSLHKTLKWVIARIELEKTTILVSKQIQI